MKKVLFLFLVCFGFLQTVESQVDARMVQYPDVSATQIIFTYAGDLWLVPKTGGTAVRLSSPVGTEYFGKFSPDGKSIAYNANYDGTTSIFVIPAGGGNPVAVTNHGMADLLMDWYPDGESLLFSSSRESGKQRFSQFYKVSKNGGLPQKLPLAYGEFASISPDGKQIAFTPKTRVFRTWKRYRGGMAADIFTFDLQSFVSANISANDANDEIPMWHGNTIYFLSDRGAEKRANIWAYDLKSKQTRQITNFKDEDVYFPSLGPSDIVFTAGGKMYLLDLSTEKYKEVEVKVVTDAIALQPKPVKVKKYMASGSISPDGKRAVLEARGELFSLPAEHGFVKNLTQSSGFAERFPAWSPDGKMIAYWTDKKGEYELAVRDMEKGGAETILTNYGPGFRYKLFWSPDSKKIAFIDQTMRVRYYDFQTKKTTDMDKALYYFEGSLQGFSASWSPDSRWVAYTVDHSNGHQIICIYDTKEGKRHQVTSGFYSEQIPVFDPEGNYLYFSTNRNFQPVYSDFENSFIYPNTTHLAALCLRKDVASPLAARNDAVDLKKEDDKKKTEEQKSDDKKKDNNKKDGDKEADKKETDEKPVEVKIDFDDIESRIVVLPAKPGNMGTLAAVKGKIIYHRIPNTGSGEEAQPIIIYDLKEREEKTLLGDADFFEVAANGEKILVAKRDDVAILKVEPDQKMEKMLPTDDMEALIDPRAEWRQIFTDAWRFERDFFYDKNMHGLDWNAVREKYGKLLNEAVVRNDVNFLIGEMIGELNASHTYRGGGDMEQATRRPVGYLGVDWAVKNGKYQIAKIIRPATWETEVRSPLDQPGIDVKEGDYVLEVNGMKLSPEQDPWFYFAGLAGKTVELMVNRYEVADSAKQVIVTLLDDETRLRNLAWIESNRREVEKASSGKIGYIYVPSTGRDGQGELVRQFYAQFDKEGLIVDERWNNGGQIPDRFIELLNRQPLAFWAVRDGNTWQWPPVANFGTKVMLINGWSGSGGDAFPDYFRKSGTGKLIGTRAWGGLIGLSGSPDLIDGGGVTVPTFRMYDPDGKWFKEGHGVDPDIEVPEDPTALAKGTDPQLQRAIQEVMKGIQNQKPLIPARPAAENRN